jgi:hypothetical protein
MSDPEPCSSLCADEEPCAITEYGCCDVKRESNFKEPEEIYLQWHGDSEDDEGEVFESFVTWSRTRIFPRDVKFVRANQTQPPQTTEQ